MPSEFMEQYLRDRRRRRRRVWMIVGALGFVFFLGPILTVVIFRQVAAARREAKWDELRAGGLGFEPDEINGFYPMPAGPNAANVYAEAFGYLTYDDEQRDILYGSREEVDKRFESIGGRVRLTEEARAAGEKLLGANTKALALLHEGAGIAESRYPLDLSQGFKTLLPFIGNLRRSASLLALEATLCADRGEADAAAESLIAALRLSDSLRNEPLIISQLVRLAAQVVAVEGVERVLQLTTLDDAALARLIEAMGAVEEPRGAWRGLIGEMNIAYAAFDYPAKDLREWVVLNTGLPGGATVLYLYVYRGTGLMDTDAVHYLGLMESAIRAAEGPMHERIVRSAEADHRLAQPGGARLLTRALGSGFGNAVRQELRVIARLRAARIALAAERYRLAEGRWPESLDALAPRFIDALPDDPFTGKPMRLSKKLTPDFTVYSVGDDLLDHGGVRENREGKPHEPGSDIPFTVTRD